MHRVPFTVGLWLSASLLALLSVCTTHCRFASAAAINLTAITASPLQTVHAAPGSKCTAPGVCVPATINLNAQTAWYWCGFYATHKTLFNVTTVKVRANATLVNVTSQWLRRDVLFGCTDNLTHLNGNLNDTNKCPIIPGSSCKSSSAKCAVRLPALSFPDDICLVVWNNKASKTSFVVQVHNFYSRPRYYGTVFSIFLIIIGGAAVLATMAYQMWCAWKAPIGHKHYEVKRRTGTTTTLLDEQDSSTGTAEEYSKLPEGPIAAAVGGADDIAQPAHQPANVWSGWLNRVFQREPGLPVTTRPLTDA